MESIGKLTEMGFTATQAQQALKATNGDLEAAIAYLFEDPIEVSGPAAPADDQSKHDSSASGSVAIRNPTDLPDFTALQAQEMLANQTDPLHFEHYEYHDGPEHQPNPQKAPRSGHPEQLPTPTQISGPGLATSLLEPRSDPDIHMSSRILASDDSSDSNRSDTEPAAPSIYDDQEMSRMRQSKTPPVVLIERAGRRENLVVPLLAILVQLPRFRALLPASDLGEHTEAWYKCEDDLDPEVELLRAVAYMCGQGKRAFISSRGVTRSLTDPDNENLEQEELVPRMYEALIYNSSDPDAMRRLLESLVESVEEEIKNKMYVFEVDLEYRATTVYETLNGLFWSLDLENLGSIRLQNTGKVVTIQFLGDDDHYGAQPLEVDEVFYPQIYAKECSDSLKAMRGDQLSVGEKRTAVTSGIMQLSSFEGKRVSLFLDQATSFLANKDDLATVDDLTAIKEQTASTVQQLTAQLAEVNKQYAELDVTNTQNLIKRVEASKNEGEGLLEPYLLAGVIFSDVEYYYRLANGEWIYVCYEISSNGSVVGYSVEKRQFRVLKEQVHQCSRDAAMVITMVYAASGEYKQAVEKTTESEFFQSDDLQLDREEEKRKQDKIQEGAESGHK